MGSACEGENLSKFRPYLLCCRTCRLPVWWFCAGLVFETLLVSRCVSSWYVSTVSACLSEPSSSPRRMQYEATRSGARTSSGAHALVYDPPLLVVHLGV